MKSNIAICIIFSVNSKLVNSFHNVSYLDNLSLWESSHRSYLSFSVTTRCMVGWMKPQALQMWGKYIIRTYNLELKKPISFVHFIGLYKYFSKLYYSAEGERWLYCRYHKKQLLRSYSDKERTLRYKIYAVT